MQIDRIAKQRNNHPDDLPDKARAGMVAEAARAARVAEASRAAKAYSCTNFVHQASSISIKPENKWRLQPTS